MPTINDPHTIGAASMAATHYKHTTHCSTVGHLAPRTTKALFAENHQHWNNFWANFQADQFDDKVSYTNSQGKAYSNTVKDIVTHNVNHATYHRAQINQLLRQNGYEPVLTDFIAYRREKTGQD